MNFPLVYGGWKLGGRGWGQVREDQAVAAVQAAWEGGVFWYDTAPVYGFGRSETLLGQILPDKGARIATKGGLYLDPSKGVYHDLSLEGLRRGLEASLHRLKRSFVDLFFIHWPDPLVPLDEALESLLLFQQEGLIKEIGLCNYPMKDLMNSRYLNQVSCFQYEYNRLNRQVEELFPYFQGKGFWAYSPLGQGALSGEIPWDYKPSRREVRRRNPLFRDSHREALGHLQKQDGSHLLERSFEFLLESPFVSGILVSSTNPDHVRENITIIKQHREG